MSSALNATNRARSCGMDASVKVSMIPTGPGFVFPFSILGKRTSLTGLTEAGIWSHCKTHTRPLNNNTLICLALLHYSMYVRWSDIRIYPPQNFLWGQKVLRYLASFCTRGRATATVARTRDSLYSERIWTSVHNQANQAITFSIPR